MARRGALHVTDGELRKLREPCPARSCDGHAAQIVLSRASWKQCTTCGHQWRFRDASSKIITREEKDELIQQRSGNRSAGEAEERRAGSRRMEQYRQEVQEMTKSKKGAKSAGKKKAKKAAKKSGSGGAARKTFSSVIRAELKKNPAAETDAVLAVVAKEFPNEKSRGGLRPREAKDVAWFRRELGIKKEPAKPVKAVKKLKKS